MTKADSQVLRDAILASPDNELEGAFAFVIDPDGYFILNKLYAKMVAFSVRK
jgi:hypothetical protein